MSIVFETLRRLGLTDHATRELYSEGTRDNAALPVWRDFCSGVIYIDDYYVGTEEYELGRYRSGTGHEIDVSSLTFDRQRDLDRRLADALPYVASKDVLDFGCGVGDFILAARAFARSVSGVELETACVEFLQKKGISCEQSLEELNGRQFDTCVAFHVLEHLQDPIFHLEEIFKSLKPGGVIYLEVPHARDALLEKLNSRAFKQHTLWSQHLVLHTRQSLTLLLQDAGFRNVTVKGVQRYSLANHIGWLASAKPGGHMSSNFDFLRNNSLETIYEQTLAAHELTDTLVAVASRP